MYSFNFYKNQRTWKWQVRIAFFTLLIFLLMPVEGVTEVGYIDTINGPQSAFVLIRDEKEIAVAPFLALQTGDKIYIREPTNNVLTNRENFIRLLLGNGKLIILRHEDTKDNPYQVTHERSSPSLVTGMITAVTNWFRGLWENDRAVVLSTTTTTK